VNAERRGEAAPSVGFGQDKLPDPPSGLALIRA
jgi:hypothetical protein